MIDRKIYIHAISRVVLLLAFSLLADLSHAIEFNNSGNRLKLEHITGNQYIFNNDIKVQITNRVIVKTAKAVTKNDIFKTDKRITKVQVLYRLKKSTYHVVTFQDVKNLPEIINHFVASPYVMSVQPDLLQIIENSHTPDKKRKKTNYIEMLDINSLWKTSKGKGVKIAIIDDGFDLNHEDLQGVNLSFGYDLESGNLDPSPRNNFDRHGTMVAGVIFAQHNKIGINGIAPEAELIALRHADTWTSKTILSFYLAKISGADIINCSWNSQIPLEPITDVINDLTSEGRGGKGIAVVFAAGNNGMELRQDTIEATHPKVIAVGSIGPEGRRLPFSNYGNHVDVYTYGSNILTSGKGPGNYLYFSGTSASAAIVSGVLALQLSQDTEMPLVSIQNSLKAIFSPE